MAENWYDISVYLFVFRIMHTLFLIFYLVLLSAFNEVQYSVKMATNISIQITFMYYVLSIKSVFICNENSLFRNV